MKQTIAQLHYTLQRIHTVGRESLESLLTAMRLLEAWDGGPFPARAVQGSLEKITVTCAADADRLLGCMQAIDMLMKEEDHDGHNEPKQDLPH